MKKDMIFFSNDGNGLTSTSANHIANLAKEMIQEMETSLTELSLFSTTVTLIGGAGPNVLNQGSSDSDVEAIIGKLHSIADAKSLIAWLREAIKAHERLLNENSRLSLADYAKEKGIELKEMPKPEPSLTEDEYFAAKSMDERCRYYSKETLAATLGKAIHPGGAFSDARKGLQEKTQRPHDVEGNGRDTLIYSYTPTVDGKVVEDVYFRLQKQYREAQAQVNAMKADCKKAMEESAIASKTAYTKAMSEWTNSRKLLEAEHSEYIQRKAKELAALKIRIPEALHEIYETVSGLGKKNA